jgi:hypothetical protein
MTFQIKKATKEQAKLRMAMFGPSGAGKTMSSLRIATGMLDGTDKRVGLIDTERGSASKYSGKGGFDFDVIELNGKKDVEIMIGAINAFAQAGHGVLIIDSLSHAWQELLAEIDRLAKTRFKGNTWSAWSEGTPKQRSLVDAILDYPGHVIATMRSKTEWTTETDSRGKSKPVRVGLAPEQGKSIEYEFDILLELSTTHVGEFIKDRTGKYQDVTVERPGEDLGRELAEWLSDGAAPVPAPSPAPVPVSKATGKPLGLSKEKAASLHKQLGVWGLGDKEQTALAEAVSKREIKSFTALNTKEAGDVFEAGRSIAEGAATLGDYGVELQEAAA